MTGRHLPVLDGTVLLVVTSGEHAGADLPTLQPLKALLLLVGGGSDLPDTIPLKSTRSSDSPVAGGVPHSFGDPLGREDDSPRVSPALFSRVVPHRASSSGLKTAEDPPRGPCKISSVDGE